MDFFPLWNSIRIALISAVVVFFSGIFCAYYVAKLPRLVKGVLDVILTLPMVLPPTVVGYFILMLLAPNAALGQMLYQQFSLKIVMTWYSAVISSSVVAFPLMYRTVRGAFESFDITLKYSGQTLGLSNTYIFWRIMMPYCKQGIIAGVVLAFARAPFATQFLSIGCHVSAKSIPSKHPSLTINALPAPLSSAGQPK